MPVRSLNSSVLKWPDLTKIKWWWSRAPDGAASKGGILSLTHALAFSQGPDRIRVNTISPGWIETGDYEKLREIDHLHHPAGRVGKPEDIARACLFLTADEYSFITGINLVIDGGMTRKMIYEP
jgi:hypothetical protein